MKFMDLVIAIVVARLQNKISMFLSEARHADFRRVDKTSEK